MKSVQEIENMLDFAHQDLSDKVNALDEKNDLVDIAIVKSAIRTLNWVLGDKENMWDCN